MRRDSNSSQAKLSFYVVFVCFVFERSERSPARSLRIIIVMAAIMSAMNNALNIALLAASERSWIETFGQHKVDIVIVWIHLVVLCGE